MEQQLLYRLIQESITNTCKHANAKRVRHFTGERAGAIADSHQGRRYGYCTRTHGREPWAAVYARLRAGLIGAAVAWLSPDPKSGKGTVVEIRHPLAPVKL